MISYIGIGSNQQDPIKQAQQAIEQVGNQANSCCLQSQILPASVSTVLDIRSIHHLLTNIDEDYQFLTKTHLKQQNICVFFL